jgi:choline kinase
MKGINIFILAAGKGSRLGKLTKNKPKILVKFEKKTILDHQLNIYSKLKKKNLYIVGGYKIKNLKKNISKKKIQLIENKNFSKTNMYYSFLQGKKLLNQKRDLIIVYGDIIFKKYVLSELLKKKKPVTLSIDKDYMKYWKLRMKNPMMDLETLKLDKSENVLEVGKKPQKKKDIQGQYIGLIKFSYKHFSLIKKLIQRFNKKYIDYKKLYMTDFIQFLIENKIKVGTSYHHGNWQEFDKPNDFKINNFNFKQQ